MTGLCHSFPPIASCRPLLTGGPVGCPDLHPSRELQPGEAPQNLILEFNPKPSNEMLVACVRGRWTSPESEELYSFAAPAAGRPGPGPPHIAVNLGESDDDRGLPVCHLEVRRKSRRAATSQLAQRQQRSSFASISLAIFSTSAPILSAARRRPSLHPNGCWPAPVISWEALSSAGQGRQDEELGSGAANNPHRPGTGLPAGRVGTIRNSSCHSPTDNSFANWANERMFRAIAQTRPAGSPFGDVAHISKGEPARFWSSLYG
jgi:hypothetical protein